NHVHLLVTPQQANGIATLMQSIGRRYVQYISTTYQRTGTVWEGRKKGDRFILRTVWKRGVDSHNPRHQQTLA
ncbi:MAG: hypothetical protein V3U27_14140, partial [Candidatus Tectomicrobia bacterium]